MKKSRRQADKRIRARLSRGKRKQWLVSWQAWQSIATIFAAIAAVFGIVSWSLEAPDRELERTATLTDTVQKLYVQLDELSDPEKYPRARLSAGFVIQKLGELNQPVLIVGDEITLERADISCVDKIEIVANSLNLIDVKLVGSNISTSAKSIYINNSVFLNSPLSQSRYYGPPVPADSDVESIVGVYDSYLLGESRFHLETEYIDFAGSVSESDHFMRAQRANIRNSFFLDHFINPPPTKLDGTLVDHDTDFTDWSFTHVGVVFREKNWDFLGLSIADTSKQLNEIVSARADEHVAAQNEHDSGMKRTLDQLCKYSTLHAFANPPRCPPFATFIGQYGEPLLDGPFGLDQYFANPISNYPYMFGTTDNSEMAKLKVRSLGSYFDPPFMPKSLAGFGVIEPDAWTRCRN